MFDYWRQRLKASVSATQASLSGSRAREWHLRASRDNKNIDRLLREVLVDDSCCIDAGAHRGDFLGLFLQFASHGKHYAFEPIPSFYETLRANYPSVIVSDVALSNENAEREFSYIPSMPAWSGLKLQVPDRECLVVRVPVRRLDDAIPTDARVDFVKIDVEGAELNVIQGGERTLKRCRPTMLFEHAYIHAHHYGTTAESIYDFVTSTLDYDVFPLDMSAPLSRAKFRRICEVSHSSNYNRSAQTNFVARPK